MSNDSLNRSEQKSRRVIEQEVFARIIPALLARPSGLQEETICHVSHSNSPKVNVEPMAEGAPSPLNEDAVASFAKLLLQGNMAACEAIVQSYLGGKLPVSTIFLDLMAPAAGLLGEAWLNDDAGFGDVSIGMSVLHGLLRRHGTLLAREAGRHDRDDSIYIVPLPSNQHVFGASMVEEFFRAHGWTVASGVGRTEHDILSAVAETHFDLVGLSIGDEAHVGKCAQFIDALRLKSRNRDLKIMVGGPIFVQAPDKVQKVGADLSAFNALEAVKSADALVLDKRR